MKGKSREGGVSVLGQGPPRETASVVVVMLVFAALGLVGWGVTSRCDQPVLAQSPDVRQLVTFAPPESRTSYRSSATGESGESRYPV